MKVLWTLVFLGFCVVVNAAPIYQDDFQYGLEPYAGFGEETEFGQHYVDATVVMVTNKYHLQFCKNVYGDGAKSRGMYVARVNKTNTIQFFCGTDKQVGDTIRIKVETGI